MKIHFSELAERLRQAADAEILAINQIECLAAWNPQLQPVVIDVRRQGEALGLAHKVMLALAARPDLALGLADILSETPCSR